jgi:hypothetical protein
LGCSPDTSTALGDDLKSVVRSDAGPPDAGTPDAGIDGPIRLRDIALTVSVRDYRSFPPFDGGDVPLNFPRFDDVRAQWRQRDGGWGLAAATRLSDAGYLIQGVPEGEAIISVRSSPLAVVTRLNALDMSYVVAGRRDSVFAPSNVATNLICSYFDMPPWESTDRFFVASFETPFAETVRGGVPPVGNRSAALTLPLNQIPVPLPEGRLGDTVSLFQLRRRQAGPLTYASLFSGATVLAPDMVPGQTATVSMPFSSPFDGGVDLDLDVDALTAAASAVRPTPPPVDSITFGINAIRGHRVAGRVNTGFRGNRTNVVVVTSDPLLPNVGRVMQRVEWATLVPTEDLIAYTFVRTDIPVRGPTFSGFFDAYHERLVALDGPSLVITSALTPVRDIRINGMSGARSSVGLTPRVSWQPPERGSVAHYTVTFQRAEPQNGSISWSAGQSFWTTQTTLDVPPFALQAGSVYAVEVRAWSGAFDPGQPDFQPSDAEISANVSDLFTP